MVAALKLSQRPPQAQYIHFKAFFAALQNSWVDRLRQKTFYTPSNRELSSHIERVDYKNHPFFQLHVNILIFMMVVNLQLVFLTPKKTNSSKKQ